MALFDWNKDGKKDFYDTFIEYNIHKRITEKNRKQDEDYNFEINYNRKNDYNRSTTKTTLGEWRIIIIPILVLLGILAAVLREDALPVILFIVVVGFGSAIIPSFFK